MVSLNPWHCHLGIRSPRFFSRDSHHPPPVREGGKMAYPGQPCVRRRCSEDAFRCGSRAGKRKGEARRCGRQGQAGAARALRSRWRHRAARGRLPPGPRAGAGLRGPEPPGHGGAWPGGKSGKNSAWPRSPSVSRRETSLTGAELQRGVLSPSGVVPL